MREKILKFHLAVLIGLLCCSMACGELSELASLRDDISNDCTVQVCSEISEAAPVLAATAVPVALSKVDKFSGTVRAVLPSARPSAPALTAVDLLHLLSIQRR